MTQEGIDDRYDELVDLSFIKQTSRGDQTVFFELSNSSIYLSYDLYNGSVYWYSTNVYHGFKNRLTFDRVLSSVSDDIKINLLFNIHLFR